MTLGRMISNACPPKNTASTIPPEALPLAMRESTSDDKFANGTARAEGREWMGRKIKEKR
jgi:hypothetical protein